MNQLAVCSPLQRKRVSFFSREPMGKGWEGDGWAFKKHLQGPCRCDRHQWYLSPHCSRSGGFRTCTTSPQDWSSDWTQRRGLTSPCVRALLRAAHSETLQTDTKEQLPLSPQEENFKHLRDSHRMDETEEDGGVLWGKELWRQGKWRREGEGDLRFSSYCSLL